MTRLQARPTDAGAVRWYSTAWSFVDKTQLSSLQVQNKHKKAVLVHRTPREAKAVYPTDWMQNFLLKISPPVKV